MQLASLSAELAYQGAWCTHKVQGLAEAQAVRYRDWSQAASPRSNGSLTKRPQTT